MAEPIRADTENSAGSEANAPIAKAIAMTSIREREGVRLGLVSGHSRSETRVKCTFNIQSGRCELRKFEFKLATDMDAHEIVTSCSTAHREHANDNRTSAAAVQEKAERIPTFNSVKVACVVSARSPPLCTTASIFVVAGLSAAIAGAWWGNRRWKAAFHASITTWD